MVEAFDPQTNKFVLRKNTGGVSITGEEVYCIFGLKICGLDVKGILEQEGDHIMDSIPEQFLDPKKENIVIDQLITSILQSGDTDEDFVRKVVLVLLDIVIAPCSTIIVTKNYYAMVHDFNRLRKLNLNEFTLQCCIDGIIKARQGKVMKKWPKGNSALIQVYRIF